ncbi:MAG: heavy metal translocating P-type ATPase [Vicinamibacterales bacterium]
MHAESVFKVDGLCCSEEVTILERRLRPMHGMEELVADVVGQRLHVKYDAALLTSAAITDAVAQTGMRAWLEHEEPIVTPSSRSRGLFVLASATMLVLGFVADAFGAPEAWRVVAYVTAILAGGVYPARKAVSALRQRTLDINVLMLVAVAGAIGLGEWAEAATVVFLFAIAQWLESRSMDRAREAIRALMNLTPIEARIKVGDHDQRRHVDQVALGAVMVVRPGEKIPLDGVVLAGQSDVNQAPITGESLPVDKGAGDEVFAGTINGHGALDVTVTRHRRDTTLARIIHLVETAQAERAPAQQFVDRFARWYTPAVIVLAILVATVPPLVAAAPFAVWFYRGLVLLVIACPCALVISTPVSIVSALAGGARQGVLIKGGVHLERLAAVRAIAFDKTGTLTKGVLRVVAISPIGVDERVLVATAASIESRSEHPIAAAIVRAAHHMRVPLVHATNVRALPGLGAEGRLDGDSVICGNARLFRDRGLMTAAADTLVDSLVSSGMSPVIVSRNGQVIGALGVADEVRDGAASVIAALHRHDITTVAMLTGDHEATARAVGARLNVDDVRAGLLPEDKVAAVRAIRAQVGAVAMIGDGVNDAPALAAADVGIAMGAMGSAAALETADIALMTDELSKVTYALRLSRATVRNIRANIAISLALKVIFLLLAVSGLASLWMAVVADTGTSLIVVANAIRLRRQV